VSTTIQSPKKRKEKKRRTKLILAAVFVAIVLLFYGVVKFFSLPSLQITGVTVQGTKMLLKEDIAKKAEEKISGNYFWFFPKKNIFLYPKLEIRADIIESFPPIFTADVSLNGSRNLEIIINERDTAAIWCGRNKPSPDILSDPGCYYVDKTGYIFSGSPRFSGNAYFTLYGNGYLKAGDPLGQYLVSSDIFSKTLALRDFLHGYKIIADNIYFGNDGYAEFFDANGFAVKWNTDQDIHPLESNMQAIFRSASWKEGVISPDPEKPDALEYLDFRFGNKIYYKQKGKEPVVPVPEESVSSGSVLPSVSDTSTSSDAASSAPGSGPTT